VKDTVEQLRARCDDLSAREQIYAVSWKKDSDVRQQMALEVNSMQVILDQKNEEIRRLRQRQSELETKVPITIVVDCLTVRSSFFRSTTLHKHVADVLLTARALYFGKHS